LIYALSLWALPLLLQWAFQGHDRMNLVAWTQVIRQSVFVCFVFIYVRDAADLLLVGAAEVVSVTIAALFSVWMYRRHFPKLVERRPAFSRNLLREGVPIGISQMFWVVKMFGATLILGLVAVPQDVGYFASAMRILVAAHTFVWLYYFNLLPSFSRAWQEGTGKLAGLIGNSARIVLFASLLVGVVWIALAPYAMKVVYGEAFVSGGGALQWMGGVCIAAAISGNFRFGLIAAGFQKKEMLTSGLGALLTGILIPIGYMQAGTNGAAAALFIAEIGILLSSWIFARQTILLKSTPNLADGAVKNVPAFLK
jgi:O-antigen/teichoic acid export membrane protein